jgi:hypothetical protein
MKYLLLLLLAGCTVDVAHQLEIQADDNCLFCIPSCDPGFACATLEGVPCEGCVVACLGAKRASCEVEPMCLNDGPAGEFQVPALCVGGRE